MKKILVALLAVVVLAGAAWLFLRPNTVVTEVPSLAGAADKFGFIKGLSEQGGSVSLLFDEAQWLADFTGPEPFKIENKELAFTNLILAPTAVIKIVDLSDEDDALREVSLEEFKAEILQEPEVFVSRPFWISFNESGLVDEVKEQYVP